MCAKGYYERRWRQQETAAYVSGSVRLCVNAPAEWCREGGREGREGRARKSKIGKHWDERKKEEPVFLVDTCGRAMFCLKGKCGCVCVSVCHHPRLKSWTLYGKWSLSQQLVFFISKGNPFILFFVLLFDVCSFPDFCLTSSLCLFCFLFAFHSSSNLLHLILLYQTPVCVMEMTDMCVFVWVCVVHSNSWRSSSCWVAVLQSGHVLAITWLTSWKGDKGKNGFTGSLIYNFHQFFANSEYIPLFVFPHTYDFTINT